MFGPGRKRSTQGAKQFMKSTLVALISSARVNPSSAKIYILVATLELSRRVFYRPEIFRFSKLITEILLFCIFFFRASDSI